MINDSTYIQLLNFRKLKEVKIYIRETMNIIIDLIQITH